MSNFTGCIIAMFAFVGIVILYFLGIGVIEVMLNRIMELLAGIPIWLLFIGGIIFMAILIRRDKG